MESVWEKGKKRFKVEGEVHYQHFTRLALDAYQTTLNLTGYPPKCVQQVSSGTDTKEARSLA